MKKEETLKQARKFITDTVWVGISQVILRMRGLITAPLLIGAYGSEGYGILAQIGATTGLLAHLMGLRLPAACVRFLSSDENKGTENMRALGGMLSATVLLNILVLTASFFGSQWLSIIIFSNSKYMMYVSLIFLWILSNCLFELLISYLRARGNIKTLTVIQLFNSLAAVLLIALFAMLYFNLQSLIQSLIAAEFIVSAGLFLLIAKKDGLPKPYFSDMKKYLMFSLPLIPLGLLRWVVDSSDRYFVTHLLALSETGVYSLCYAVGGAISMFSFPIFFVLFPTISKEWDNKNYNRVKTYFGYSTSIFLLIAVPVSVLLYFISEPILLALMSAQITIRSDVIFLVALSTVMAGVFQINVYIVYLIKRPQLMLFVFILGAGMNILLNILLIPLMGISGAAVSTFIAYFILCVAMTFLGRRLLQYTLIDFNFIAKLLAATSVMTLWLYFHRIRGVIDMISSVGIAALVFGGAVFILKIFTREELKMIRGTLFRK